MTTTKPFYRYLSIFLIFVFISGIIQMPVKAANNLAPVNKNSSIKADIGEIPNKLPKSKLELTSKRTKYSTRYLNPNGSFTEEIFLEPQFYKDLTDKKWKKLDNNLKVSSKDASKLENTSNDFKVSFASEAKSNEVVSVEKEGKKIALVPIGGKATKGTIKNNEITYDDMFNNTDAKYTVQGDSLKEDLILNSYSNQNTFTFEVKLNGLKADVEKDGTITFSDSKSNKVWYFETPYMVDANSKLSNDVKLNLRAESGKTYVDVVADKAFLEDSNTKYPVVIDPTINNWDTIRDTFISSSQPDTSYSSIISMYTGFTPSYGATRSLAQFSMSSLPSDSKISSANFNVYQTKSDATNVAIDLFKITSSWTGSSTWNTQPSTSLTKESTVTSNTYNQYWQWDTTQLVKDWYNGVLPNYGLMLKQQSESTAPYRAFNTVNGGSNTPRITIDYTVDPIGLEDFWSYTKDGVNPSNGNLVLQSNDISVPGKGVPVSVTRTYNSRKSNVANSFGYGWISNLEATLVDSGNGPITLIDGDNTRHIFGQNVYGGYESPGGVYLSLVKNGDGSYIITQLDGTKINFNTSGKTSSIVDTNGNITTYSYVSSKLSTITDASGRTTTISYGTNGYVSSIIDSASHTTSYEYDVSGNLIKVTDAASNITSLAYNAAHKLTSVTDARNIITSIAYDASDRVSTVTHPITIDGTVTNSVTIYTYDTTNMVTTATDGEGKRIAYTYNANGNVVQVTENPLDAAKKAVTTYAYDNNNNLVEVIDANENKISGTSSYVYNYDLNGNVTSVKLPENQSSTYIHDSNNNVTSQNDFNGNTSLSSYDSKNNNIEATDPNTQTVASRYDSSGNLLYSTEPMSTADNLISNSSFEMDENADNWSDNWTSATESGKTATFAWSATSKFGNKSVSVSNPTGWAIAYSDTVPYVTGDKYIVSGYVKTTGTTNTGIVKVEFLDSLNNWLGQKSAYALKGDHDWTRIQAVVDSIPLNTSKVRVSVGLNAGTGTAYFDGIQLEKGTVLSAYNLVDNSSFEKDTDVNKVPDNWTTSSNLSVNDGIQSSEVYTGNNSFKLTGESGKNKYIKQHINYSGAVNDPLTLSGWSKQVGASVNGGDYSLQIAINNTDGTVDWTNSNDFSKTDNGWQHAATAEIKPQKAYNSVDVYYYFYNQTGSAYFDSMRLEAQGTFTTNSYDAKGNYVTSVKDPNGNTVLLGNDAAGNKTSVTDAKSKITSFEYNPLNLLTKVTDAKNGVTSYNYDGNSNRTKVTDARNNVTNYNYNEFNSVSKITNPLNQILQFGYDKNGNTTKVISPKGDTLSYTYDALNRNDGVYYNGTQKWGLGYDANGNLITTTESSSGKATSYIYDKNNRVTEVSEGASNKIHYTLDDNNNQTNLAITAGSTTVNNGSSYNSLDQLIALSRNSSNIISFVYDERGNVISANRFNGTYTSFEYDGGNRIKSVKNYRAQGLLVDSYTYSYDANSNITSVVTNTGTISYQYDDLNQLTQETLLNGNIVSYEYDTAGNRTKKTVNQAGNITTTNYTNDAGNQLTAVNGQAYTYDANGNLTSNGAKTFVYDIENHLTQVKNSVGTVIASFIYDHEGKRISMTTPSGTTSFHYSGDKVAYETDSANNITAEYTWDALGNPVTMTKSGVTYYYHVNAHGDVTAMTDAAGNIAAQYSYDSWGNILSQTGAMASSNPYRYAGYRYDESTGLYYLMARYYDANAGRFITRDTFHGTEGDAISLNQYAYCSNNPANMVDPSGHFKVSVSKATIAFTILLALFPYIVGLSGNMRAFSIAARYNSWSRKMLDIVVTKISRAIYSVLNDFARNLLRHGGNAAVRSATVASIKPIVSGFAIFSPAYIIAKILDRFDRDGNNGYITY